MKKLITVILILALVLPVLVLADNDAVDEYYGYASIEVSKTGAPTMFFLYFYKNQTCYYVAQQFHEDSPGLGRTYVGTWGYTSDGKIFAKIGDNTSVTLKPVEGMGALVDTSTYTVYYPVSALMD